MFDFQSSGFKNMLAASSIMKILSDDNQKTTRVTCQSRGSARLTTSI
jgi:hypothetical protein